MKKNIAIAVGLLMVAMAVVPAASAQLPFLSAHAGANWSCASNQPTCSYFQAVGFHGSTVPLVATGTLYLNGAFQDVCQVVALSCGTSGPSVPVPHGFAYVVVAVTTAPGGTPAADTDSGITP